MNSANILTDKEQKAILAAEKRRLERIRLQKVKQRRKIQTILKQRILESKSRK